MPPAPAGCRRHRPGPRGRHRGGHGRHRRPGRRLPDRFGGRGGRLDIDLGAPEATVPTTVAISPVVTAATSTAPPAIAVAPVTTVPRRPTTIPSVNVPTTAPAPAGTTLPMTAPTTSPLPVPELFDVRNGIGTPCDADGRIPQGCFIFVYATTATKGWDHRLSSDAPFRTAYTLRTDGNACSTANPHHSDRESCHWYIGPVQGRTAGQRECFWLTTVDGAHESEPSNSVCLTWTDGAAWQIYEPAVAHELTHRYSTTTLIDEFNGPARSEQVKAETTEEHPCASSSASS